MSAVAIPIAQYGRHPKPDWDLVLLLVVVALLLLSVFG